jgi:hypothetical protein
MFSARKQMELEITTLNTQKDKYCILPSVESKYIKIKT